MTHPSWLPLVERLKQALARHDRAGANAAVEQLLDSRAQIGSHWSSISHLMQVSGELTLARRAIDSLISEAGGSPQSLYAKVVLLTQSGRLAEAHDLLSTLPEDVPDRAGRAYVLGNTALTLGRIDEAREQLSVAVRERPGWGPAWLSLATAGDLAGDPLGERMLADGPAAERHAPAELARYCYALGKLHADRGDTDASFAAYARGARLLRSQTPYSLKGNTANAEAAMTGFPPGFIEQLNQRQSTATGRPIFVTGLPRSGTTLVEQILASHSTVIDGGELNIIQHVAVAVGGVSGEALERYLAGGGSLEAMADLYLHLVNERFGATGRVVDKTIDISRCLGLVAAILPDAPLIWMRRDPLDSALSCFRTFFIHGVAWSYDLVDIAHHFKLEDMLLAFWKARLGDRLLVAPYAELVEEPELWTRRLLDHCGLSDEAAVHAPHKTQRVVATASALQVRSPINRKGLNIAEPYRAQMKPFIDAYFS